MNGQHNKKEGILFRHLLLCFKLVFCRKITMYCEYERDRKDY